MLGGRSWDEWIARYSHSHQHPVNRLCHTLGIPLIVVSLALAPMTLLVPLLGWIALALFMVGWILQFAGHAVDEAATPGPLA